jgi:hypothetical protein
MKRHVLYAMLSLLWQPALAQDWRQVIPGFSDLQRNPTLPKDYAESLTELLLPAAEWKAERLSFAHESARAYQVTYTKGGGIITVDRVMTKGNCRFSINIASPTSARIRHQIMIGTDMAEWEIIRRDPPSSEGQPFARTYFLRLPNSGRLRGLAFYEGTWAELDWGGLMPVPKGTEDSLLRLTWNVAQRLRQNYEQQIARIARSLDDGSPAPTRPDLPDADTRLEKPTRKPVFKQQVLD